MAKKIDNPPWTTEEIILLIDLYSRHHPMFINENHEEVIKLSNTLRALPFHESIPDIEKFRNPTGVYMKLRNLLRHDPNPEYARKGLIANIREGELFRHYFSNPTLLRQKVQEILKKYSTQNYGKFYSWALSSTQNIAIKELDKSAFLHHGTGIPIDVRSFFNVENIHQGEKVDVVLRYKGISYSTNINMTVHDRTRLFWKADFSNLLAKLYPQLYSAYSKGIESQGPQPRLCFHKQDIEDRVYDVSFPITEELNRRLNIWTTLKAGGGPERVSLALLRELKIYGGAQGIWVDKVLTGNLTADKKGVTVGLLHTGSSYDDDISIDGVIYHYPQTKRPSGRDQAEIDATKAAGALGLPVFVITYPNPNSTLRNVHLGWVESWDDNLKTFLINFGDTPPIKLLIEQPADDEPFMLTDKTDIAWREIEARKGQHRFKFRVLSRYGPTCAVCGLDTPELLDAAHIRPKKEHGSDDPRNGLVLCATHHRAFDAGFFAIEPNTLIIHYKEGGPSANKLKITYPSIDHLVQKPHKEALEWLWQRWNR